MSYTKNRHHSDDVKNMDDFKCIKNVHSTSFVRMNEEEASFFQLTKLAYKCVCVEERRKGRKC